MEAFNSPFIVPVAAISIAAVAIVSGAINQMQARRIKADQRLEMVARGLSAADIERLLGSGAAGDAARTSYRDPIRSMTNARRVSLILCSSGIGIILFFVALVFILQEKDILAGAATGLVPLAIGAGFFLDYRLQKRDLARIESELARATGE